MEKVKILELIKKIRENGEKKRNFNQSVDLIINLKNFDIKKDSVNLFLELPHKVRDVKIAAFLNKRSTLTDTITKSEFDKYKDKKAIKKLVKSYDFFISSASLMPLIASAFGRYLGTAGKMPSPQLGIIRAETDEEIKNSLEKFQKVVRIKSKEPSLKFSAGKENMKDGEIAENIISAYTAILNSLPRKKENIKNAMIKFTMGKPLKLET